jgi:transposase
VEYKLVKISKPTRRSVNDFGIRTANSSSTLRADSGVDALKRLFRLFSFLAPLAEPLIKRLEGAFEGRGPDGYSCRALLFSLIAMYVEKIKNRAELVRRLKGDPRFAWVCGFEPFGKTPSESTFSRFFSKLSETSGLLGLFFELVKKGREMGHIGDEAAAVDGSHIHAYVTPPKPLNKKEKEQVLKEQEKRKAEAAIECETEIEKTAEATLEPRADVEVGRAESHEEIDATKTMVPDSGPTQASVAPTCVLDLPQEPAWGAKRNSQGNVFFWYGYKIHVLVDTQSEMPVAFWVASANIHDKTVFLPLIRLQKENVPDLNFKFYIADEAYDSRDVYEAIRKEFQAQAIIPLNIRGAKEPPPGFDYDGTPVCTAGLRMVYWGSDGERNKFRCPEAVGKCTCPLQMNCSNSPYGLTVHCEIDEDPRRFSNPQRGSRYYEELKDKRSSVERFNARGKVHLKMDDLTVQGFSKVMAHMTLMCIAMLAGTLAQVEAQKTTGLQLKKAA